MAKNLWKWVKKVGGARGFLDSNLMVSFRPSSTLKVGRQRHEIRDIIMTTLDLEQSKIEQISHFFDRVRLCMSYNYPCNRSCKADYTVFLDDIFVSLLLKIR